MDTIMKEFYKATGGQLWFCPNCFETWEMSSGVMSDFFPDSMEALDEALHEHLVARRDCALVIFDATT